MLLSWFEPSSKVQKFIFESIDPLDKRQGFSPINFKGLSVKLKAQEQGEKQNVEANRLPVVPDWATLWGARVGPKAQTILAQSGVDAGLAVHLAPDAEMSLALTNRQRIVVHGLA